MSRQSRSSCERLKDLIYEYTFIANSSVRKDLASAQRLRFLLSYEKVKDVLECPCGNCAEQKEGIWQTSSSHLVAWVTSSAQLIFALLTYSGCPQLIQCFVEKSFDDAAVSDYVGSLTANCLSHNFWPAFDAVNPGRSRRLAGQVEEYKYKFFVPILNDRITSGSEIQSFDEDAILPFAKQELIGTRLRNGQIAEQGGFGKVYGFKPLEEYVDFQGKNHSIPLVRKEVDYCTQDGLPEELFILLHVRNLDDENVVRLVTAYTHGSKINYVFPRAETNLEQFLRGLPNEATLAIHDIEQHPLWEQMLGVIRAVYRIHNDVYHTTSGKQIKLYHFDLKPANILVDISEGKIKLLVADFGFSRFRTTATHAVSSSYITGYGATPAYAPPEREKSDNRWNHRFDVWSLGCILLELIAFVVDGHEGVRKLDSARYTEERGPHCTDDYFWHPVAHDKIEVKPTVIDWMNKLLESSNVRSKSTAEFLDAVWTLATGMMAIDVSKRLDVDAAQYKLSEILKSRGKLSSIAGHTLTAPDDSDDSDNSSVLVGQHELESIKSVTCKHGPWFDDVQLRLREDFMSVLWLEMRKNSSRLAPIALGSRDKVSLIPSPALNESTDHRVVILRAEKRNPHFNVVIIDLSKLSDTAMLQSVLSSQAVRSFYKATRRSLPIISIQIKKHTGLSGFLGSDRKSSALSDLLGRPRAIQLWSERFYKDLNAWYRLKPRRASPRFTFEVPQRRIVIHCEKALVIVCFAKNVRLEKPSCNDKRLRHKIVPTDQRLSSRDRSFELAVLESRGRNPIAIPLDNVQLAAMEEQAAVECSCLEIEFANRGDWEEFQRKYRFMKKEWTDEHDEMQREKKYGAEGRGWAPEHGY